MPTEKLPAFPPVAAGETALLTVMVLPVPALAGPGYTAAIVGSAPMTADLVLGKDIVRSPDSPDCVQIIGDHA